MWGRVLYDYSPVRNENEEEEDEEVELFVNDTVEIVEMYDDGWWKVCARTEDGQQSIGLAPSNYIELIESDFSESSNKLENFSSENQDVIAITRTSPQHNLVHHRNDSVDMKASHAILSRNISLDSLGDLRQMNKSDHAGAALSRDPFSNSLQSTDLDRLRELREQAEEKISALRKAVSSNETHANSGLKFHSASSSRDSDQQDYEELKRLSQGSKLANLTPRLQTPPTLTPLRGKEEKEAARKKYSKPINESFDNTPAAIPQVTLDPKSLSFISKIVNERIEKEFTVRDGKLLNKVKQMILAVDAVVAVATARSSVDGKGDSDRDPPPLQLPKIKPSTRISQQTKEKEKEESKDNEDEAISGREDKLPVLLPKPSSKVPKEKEKKASNENDGIRYQNCRSMVYAPSAAGNAVGAPPAALSSKLVLSHVYGYEGDFNRHGNILKGKNIVFIDEERIIFPAAAVVVLMSTTTADRRQSFFCGHSDDVTCLAVPPDQSLGIAASGQKGKDGGLVLVWSHASLRSGESEAKSLVKLKPSSGATRGICSLSFSAGSCRFLVVMAIDESHSLIVYDWRSGTAVATAKVGQLDAQQVLFNHHLYSSNEAAAVPDYPVGADAVSSCHTLVTYGGKHIKFWTLTGALTMGEGLEELSSFKGRKLKQQQRVQCLYSLDGSIGTAQSYGATNDSITCAVCVEDKQEASGRPRSRIFTGSSNGSILIWQQPEDSPPPPPPPPSPAPSAVWRWLSKGRLVAVVADAHDSPMLDLDSTLTAKFDPSRRLTVVSTSVDGIVSVWKVNESTAASARKKGQQPPLLPLDHVLSVELPKTDYVRSISWRTAGRGVDDGSMVAVLGTVQNNIHILAYEDLGEGASPSNGQPVSSASLSLLHGGHSGKVKRVAVHPFIANIFASISADGTVRLWNSQLRQQVSSFQYSSAVLEDDPKATGGSLLASCLTFCPDGRLLAIGDECGQLCFFESAYLHHLVDAHVKREKRGRRPQQGSGDRRRSKLQISIDSDSEETTLDATDPDSHIWSLVTKRSIAGSAQGSSKAVQSPSAEARRRPSFSGSPRSSAMADNGSTSRKRAAMEIRFSPTGGGGGGGVRNTVAVSCKDNLIHILEYVISSKGAVRFKRVAVCRGHTTFARSLDYSRDGKVLMSSDAAKELFFWDVLTGQRIHAATLRDETWDSWTSLVGWPVMGAHNTVTFPADSSNSSNSNSTSSTSSGASGKGHPHTHSLEGSEGTVAVGGGDVNCLCRSPDGNLVAVGSSQTVRHAVKLFSFPCAQEAVPGVYGGHTSPVIDIAFLGGGEDREKQSLGLISAGGNDCCMFQWSVVPKR